MTLNVTHELSLCDMEDMNVTAGLCRGRVPWPMAGGEMSQQATCRGGAPQHEERREARVSHLEHEQSLG